MMVMCSFVSSTILPSAGQWRKPAVTTKRPSRPIQVQARKGWKTPVAMAGPNEADEVGDKFEVETTMIKEEDALDPESGSVTVKPSFNFAATCLLLGGALDYVGGGGLVVGLPVTALGVLLTIQTTRVRFIFGPTRMSVCKRAGDGLKIIRGWKYDEIKNWEMWWPGFPVLAYFKETESYNGRGSVHFFPMMFCGKQFVEQFKIRVPQIDKSNYT